MNTYGLLGDVTGTPHPDPNVLLLRNNHFHRIDFAPERRHTSFEVEPVLYDLLFD
jgi:hypothetical protein